jgi:hypothetical protein
MRRVVLTLTGLGCVLAVIVFCYKPVILGGEQFAYRDAGCYYYPLHLQVQREWKAGRWPLWDPSQNGGMPLLGNPTAAVLYPGKLVFALLPYALAARLYVIAHTLLAFIGMLALGRTWRLSWTASMIAGLSYAFGAPVLFQYCNVIYLVGAAWMPFGLRGTERFLRQGRLGGLLELALALAMQLLGGDPQAAYLTGLCGGGYAVGLAVASSPLAFPWRGRMPLLLALCAFSIWVLVTLCMANMSAEVAVQRSKTSLIGSRVSSAAIASLAWVLVILTALWAGRRRPETAVLARGLAGLGGACVLALALAAAQLLPSLEFTSECVRLMSGVPIENDRFSLEPYRAVELIWPSFFGTTFPENSCWLQVIPPASLHEIWVPSLYMGCLPLALALSASGFRGGKPWRGWLTAIALLGLVSSLGKFSGPLWWARWLPSWTAWLGPHDPMGEGSLRTDGYAADGAGSLYQVLATLLPGFGSFRYPCKLLSLTSLAIAGLAGEGWDRIVTGRSCRAVMVCLVLLAFTAVAGSAFLIGRPSIAPELARRAQGALSIHGPINAPRALSAVSRALLQGGLALAVSLWLAWQARRWPWSASIVALIALTIDLSLAGSRIVWTIPQAEFDRKPRALEVIQSVEASDPAGGPFRVHRMPAWHPDAFFRSGRTLNELIAWERDTLLPGYGSTYDLRYTMTVGVLELYDYLQLFRPKASPASRRDAEFLGIAPGQLINAFPRRSFDLWNTKYFVLPVRPDNWTGDIRGYASFLRQTDLIYPRVDQFSAPDGKQEGVRWRAEEDWQIFRNKAAYPRAWIVHDARWFKPLDDGPSSDRDLLMGGLLFQNDAFWSDPHRPVLDAHKIAWVETEDRSTLKTFCSGGPRDPTEKVVVSHTPQRVELTATLRRPGLVILADAYYPGWRLQIDGKDAPILRANRMMRAAGVAAGTHRLVYWYDPTSFWIGSRLSASGLAVCLVLSAWTWRLPNTKTSSGGLN